jgi:hypothetical protein
MSQKRSCRVGAAQAARFWVYYDVNGKSRRRGWAKSLVAAKTCAGQEPKAYVFDTKTRNSHYRTWGRNWEQM